MDLHFDSDGNFHMRFKKYEDNGHVHDLEFFLAQVENSIAVKHQNTTNLVKPTHPEWKSRNNAHLWHTYPCND